MQVALTRGIKNFVSDFRAIRRILKDVGARKIESKQQVDYYFNLPTDKERKHSMRLKLRYESGKPKIVYYYDSAQSPKSVAQFRMYKIFYPSLKDLLEACLGISVVVKKRREIWRKGAAVFNLDTIDNLGKVFELEIEKTTDVADEVGHYLNLFKAHLGRPIRGSNEDLVKASNKS